MKHTNRNLVVAVVFMLGTLFNYATDLKKSSKNTKYVKVVFENVEKGHSLIIKDKEGVILHRENVSRNGELVKFFDFSSLEDGNYNIEVNKEFEILVKKFEVKNSEITFKKEAENIVFKPIIQNKNNRVLVSRVNLDKTPINVAIYYKETLILKEEINSDTNLVKKVYRLDESVKGNYKVVVSNNSKSYVKELSL